MRNGFDPLLQDEVRPVLEAGEEVLWAGRPDPRRTALIKVGQALAGAAFIVLFFLTYLSGLPALGTAAGADAMAFGLRLTGVAVIILLILCGMLLPVLSYQAATHTVYAVTDRRILSVIKGRTPKAVRFEDIQVPLLDPGRHERGDIHLHGRVRAGGAEQPLQFSRLLGIESAESVYQLLLGQMRGTGHVRVGSRAEADYLELLLQGKENGEAGAHREHRSRSASDLQPPFASRRGAGMASSETARAR